METRLIQGFPDDQPPKLNIVLTAFIGGLEYFALISLITLLTPSNCQSEIGCTQFILLQLIFSILGSIATIFLYDYFPFDVIGHDYKLTENLGFIHLLFTFMYFFLGGIAVLLIALVATIFLLPFAFLFFVFSIPAAIISVVLLTIVIIVFEATPNFYFFISFHVIVTLTLMTYYYRERIRKFFTGDIKTSNKVKVGSFLRNIRDIEVRDNYIYCLVGNQVRIIRYYQENQNMGFELSAILVGHRSDISNIYFSNDFIYTISELNPAIGIWETRDWVFRGSLLEDIKHVNIQRNQVHSRSYRNTRDYEKYYEEAINDGLSKNEADNLARSQMDSSNYNNFGEFYRFNATAINEYWIVLDGSDGLKVYDHSNVLKYEFKRFYRMSRNDLHIVGNSLYVCDLNSFEDENSLFKFNLLNDTTEAEQVIELPKIISKFQFSDHKIIVLSEDNLIFIDLMNSSGDRFSIKIDKEYIEYFEFWEGKIYILNRKAESSQNGIYQYTLNRYTKNGESTTIVSFNEKLIKSFRLIKTGLIVQTANYLQYFNFS